MLLLLLLLELLVLVFYCDGGSVATNLWRCCQATCFTERRP